jgi:hypothetical protein
MDKLLTNEGDQIKRWFEHFSDLFSIPTDDSTEPCHLKRTPSITRINTSPTSKLEITKAIINLKAHKAPRFDQITAEMLKADINLSADVVKSFFSKKYGNLKSFLKIGFKAFLLKSLKKEFQATVITGKVLCYFVFHSKCFAK